MFGFNALLIDIIFHPERGKVKWLQGSHYLKKGKTVENTLFSYKKKYLKLLIRIQLACVCEG